MASLFGVLVLGILQGVALGVVLSLTVLIRRVSRPATAVLGRVPGTDAYRDVSTHPGTETIAGMLIYRFDAPIIFSNAGYFADEVRRLVGASAIPVRDVLVAAQPTSHLDSTGADQLSRLRTELEAKGIGLSFAETKGALREAFRRTGLESKIGAERFYDSIEDGVREILERRKKDVG
jgi:MFS superfamily sulfate permease-like transporter